MSQNQGDFTPAVKGGYESDDAYHRRNWRALTEFLRSPFVTSERLADASITTAKIGEAQITDAQIGSLSADKISAGTLNADVLLSGQIYTGSSPGQRVEMDSEGIRAYNSSNIQTVAIPTAGSPFFSGALTADSLEIIGQAVVRSLGNSIASDADLILDSDGVANPTTPPFISWDYEFVGLSGSWTGAAGQGYYDSGAGRVYIGSGGYIRWYNSTTGAYIGEKFISTDLVGFTKSSSHYCVLTCTSGGTAYLYRYSDSDLSTLTDSGTINVTSGLTYYGSTIRANGMTWDATNSRLMINVRYRSNPLPGPAIYSSSLRWHQQDRSFDRQAGGTSSSTDLYYDGTTLWAAFGTADIYAYTVVYATPSVTADSSKNFSPYGTANTIMAGTTALASVLDDAATWRQFTSWTDSTSYIHARYTWYNNGAGTETLGSNAATVAYRKRARLNVSIASSIPTGADRFRFYMEESASATPSSQTSSNYKRQGTYTTSPQYLTSFASGGAAIPTSNTTSGGTTPGELKTTDGGFSLLGDGTMILPTFNGAPSPATAGQIYYDSGTSKAYVYNGSGWQALW